MGPGERAVAPERAPEPPRRAFPELRALTRGPQSLAETRCDPLVRATKRERSQPGRLFRSLWISRSSSREADSDRLLGSFAWL